MAECTAQQVAVFRFIEQALLSGGPAPSYGEIASHFRFASKTTARHHVCALENKWLLEREAGKARSIRLVNFARKLRERAVEIPLTGYVPAAGTAARTQEAHEWLQLTAGYVAFKPTRNSFYLRITGDSMIGKHIRDGDLGMFEHSTEPRPGQIVVAFIDGGRTLKTFMIRNGQPYLHAENPKYPDLFPARELRILGVMVGLIREIHPAGTEAAPNEHGTTPPPNMTRHSKVRSRLPLDGEADMAARCLVEP